MSLERYQQRFADALLAPESCMPPGLFEDRPINSLAWRVYRNNVHFSLMTALAEAYPVVYRLLGDEAFAVLAQSYVQQQPPTSPILVEFGSGFAAHLRGELEQPLASFVPDVATLEWLYLQSQNAEDAAPLDLHALANIPQDELPELSLALHPSVRLFRSSVPALSIWQTNKREERKPIQLDAGGEAALLLRPQDEVLVLPLEPAVFEALQQLGAGHSIASSFASLASEITTTTLATLFVQGGVVTYFNPEK